MTSAASPPLLRPLRAGPLELYLAGADVRYAGVSGHELLRRVYTAVRDLDWDTARQTIVGLDVRERGDGFTATVEVEHRSAEIALDSVVTVTGAAGGGLEYVMRARAINSFEYAKVGICLHHPIAGLAGRPYRAVGPAGVFSGAMPVAIAPQIHLSEDEWDLPIFPPFTELELEHEGALVRLSFEGDEFEVEDQRNWSDQSYKTSSTPAERGYRFAMESGTDIVQRVRVAVSRVSPAPSRRHRAGPPVDAAIEVEVGAATGRRPPPIGLGWTPAGDPAPELDDVEIALLAGLRPAHLRLDLHLGNDGWCERLDEALGACATVGAGLELALFLGGEPRPRLHELGERLRAAAVPIGRVLVFRSDEEATRPHWVVLAREHLGLDAPLGGGTNLYFNELNRSGVDLSPCDVVAYSNNPQIHAFDDLSMTEALEGQAEQVRSARALAAGRILAVSPITLRPRFNAVAVTEGALSASSNIDPRQNTRFAATWTAGSIAELIAAGADSLTYFETVGPRGVVVGGRPVPAYHVLADLAAVAGGDVLACSTSAEPWICAIAARSGDATQVVVANLTEMSRTMRVRGVRGPVRVRVLDADTDERARARPGEFRAALHEVTVGAAIALGPQAVATVFAAG